MSKPGDDDEEDIEPVINNIREIQEKCNGPLDISGMGLEKLTLEKVRQLQNMTCFMVQCIIIYKTDIYQWKKC